jgi:hypothetical protein
MTGWLSDEASIAGDHAMNTTIRRMRPDPAKQFEAKVGMTCEEFF